VAAATAKESGAELTDEFEVMKHRRLSRYLCLPAAVWLPELVGKRADPGAQCNPFRTQPCLHKILVYFKFLVSLTIRAGQQPLRRGPALRGAVWPLFFLTRSAGFPIYFNLDQLEMGKNPDSLFPHPFS
jgi:hypothetical protein